MPRLPGKKIKTRRKSGLEKIIEHQLLIFLSDVSWFWIVIIIDASPPFYASHIRHAAILHNVSSIFIDTACIFLFLSLFWTFHSLFAWFFILISLSAPSIHVTDSPFIICQISLIHDHDHYCWFLNVFIQDFSHHFTIISEISTIAFLYIVPLLLFT